jgi:2-C-methyl-D-erythritol 4-phosphate cytidylyltransferase
MRPSRTTSKSVAVIVVAAGRGTRMGGEVPKQYVPILDRTPLRRSCEAFLGIEAVGRVLPVIGAGDRAICDAALEGVSDHRLLAPAEGGGTRASSVRRGLEALAGDPPDKVLIHDAARPFVPERVIREIIEALDEVPGAAAALPVVDALWQAEDGLARRPVPRDGLWRAQTPQGFRFDAILAAHRAHDGSGADDVAVAREAGIEVRLVPGSERNYKITTPEDLKRAIADARALRGG